MRLWRLLTETDTVQDMQRKGATYARQRDKDLVGKCFGIWKRMERGQLLHKVQEQRLLSHVFVKWRGSHETLSRLQSKCCPT